MRMDAAEHSARPRSAAAGPIAFAIALALCFLALLSRGHDASGDRAAAIINGVILVVNAGILAATYVLAGIGFGRPLVAMVRRAPGLRDAEATVGPMWLQAALGTGAILWLSHMLGVMGFLSGPIGLWISWGSLIIGLLLLADQVARGPLRPEKWTALPIWAALAAPALAVLFAAACSPPGALWLGARSEGGGYDVLSYHLQLPKEWIAAGSRLQPLEHNVYSFLPGYMEAAFLHIGALVRGGLPSGGSFVSGTGLGVIASQFLHAWMGVLTALFIARGGYLLAARNAPSTASNSVLPGVVAGASVIAVPWVVVVGSLAYNDLGVTAALAGAILVSMERSWSAAARGIGVGLLMGIACSIKPTALLMAAPVAAIFLFFARPQSIRDRLVAALTGAAAGLFTLAPWLVRNWIAAKNPFFPFASGFFGNSHWTQEQMERYASAHAFQGSIGDRIALFFDSDRGIFNEQWAVLFPLGLVAIIVLAVRRPTRRSGVLLLIALVSQIAAWLFFTHLQSRFLLPAVVPLTLGLGIATSELIRWVGARTASFPRGHPLARLAMLVAAIVPLSLTAWSWLIFASQRGGQPNQLLAAGGVELLTGHSYAAQFNQLQSGEQLRELRNLPPAPYINFTFTLDDAVLFLGSATPLYYLPEGGTPSVVYNTTWDHNPLGDAIRAHPDDPAAWTAAVRSAGGGPPVGFVLVDFDELSRLATRADNKRSWYDPDVTPERLQRWLKQECELVRSWAPGDVGGIYLFRLKNAGATGGTR